MKASDIAYAIKILSDEHTRLTEAIDIQKIWQEGASDKNRMEYKQNENRLIKQRNEIDLLLESINTTFENK